MNIPKKKDLLEKVENAPDFHREKQAESILSYLFESMYHMAESGGQAIHTDAIRKAQALSPGKVMDVIARLEKDGFTIVETEVGHEIKWLK